MVPAIFEITGNSHAQGRESQSVGTANTTNAAQKSWVNLNGLSSDGAFMLFCPNEKLNRTRLRVPVGSQVPEPAAPGGWIEIEIIGRKFLALPIEGSPYNRRGRGGCSAQIYEPATLARGELSALGRTADDVLGYSRRDQLCRELVFLPRAAAYQNGDPTEGRRVTKNQVGGFAGLSSGNGYAAGGGISKSASSGTSGSWRKTAWKSNRGQKNRQEIFANCNRLRLQLSMPNPSPHLP